MLADATPPPALVVAVSPAKAGTAAKPRPVQVQLAIAGATSATRVVVYFPSALRISNTGLPQCTLSDAKILQGGCQTAIAGSGAVTAAATPFQVTPLVGAKDLLFRVTGATNAKVLHGKLSGASGLYAAKLTIALPGFMRQLSQLSCTMKLAHGSHTLFATRGCPSGGLPFQVALGATKVNAKARCS
jgi:hypothetical protein